MEQELKARCQAVVNGKQCRAHKNLNTITIGSGVWVPSMFWNIAGVIKINLCPLHFKRREEQ